jgi:hypothetical protein
MIKHNLKNQPGQQFRNRGSTHELGIPSISSTDVGGGGRILWHWCHKKSMAPPLIFLATCDTACNMHDFLFLFRIGVKLIFWAGSYYT